MSYPSAQWGDYPPVWQGYHPFAPDLPPNMPSTPGFSHHQGPLPTPPSHPSYTSRIQVSPSNFYGNHAPPRGSKRVAFENAPPPDLFSTPITSHATPSLADPFDTRPTKRQCSVPAAGPSSSSPRSPLRPTSAHNKPRQTRQKGRTMEEKLSVVLETMKEVHFKGLGHFLEVLFDPTASYVDQDLLQTITKFLQSGSQLKVGRRPVDIVKSWYDHPKSQANNKSTLHPSIIPPTSLPTGFSFEQDALDNTPTGTKRELEEWAASVAIGIVKQEGLSLGTEKVFQSPDTWTWGILESVTIDSLRSKIISLAPLTWSIWTSLTVSPARELNSEIAHAAFDASTDETDRQKICDTEDHLSHSPWSATTLLLLMALSLRNPLATLIPSLIALLLFMTNTSRLVYHALGRIGITTAYSTTLRRLQTLSEDAGNTVRGLAANITETGGHFLIVFDNINKHHRMWDPSISHSDEVRSGTSAMAVRMHSVGAGAMNSKAYKDKVAECGRKGLTVDVLRKDIDHRHIASIGAASLLRIWTKHIPSLKKYASRVEQLFKEVLKKHPIPIHRSDIFPLRTSGIDESTAAGNRDVLDDITRGQMEFPDWVFSKLLIPIAGDQLTIDRIRKLIHYTRKDISDYGRHTWALPFIQLWHMKWAFLKAIFKAHFPPSLSKYLCGLHADCSTLGRDKLNPTKCDFHQHHAALIDTFEASCLGLLRMLAYEELGSPPDQSGERLIDELDALFTKDGRLSDKPFAFFTALAKKCYHRYLCQAAYEDALHGESQSNAATPHPPNCMKDPHLKGDHVLSNLILRLRDSLWYYEMCHSISDGDTGRVIEIIKVLRFYFWGSGSTNYGNELLELACNFLYEFPEPLQHALLSNWLVNPTGRAGHFHELDLEMEHANDTIKNVIDDRSLGFDSPFVQSLALNVRGFDQLRHFISDFFNITLGSGNHDDPDLSGDMNLLGARHVSDDIFHFHPGRSQSWVSSDFFVMGYNKLESGHLETFKERTIQSHISVQPDDSVDE